MPHRPVIAICSEQARGNTSAAIARAHLLDIEVDRPKRIDQYLDYFGSGGESGGSARLASRGQPSPATVGKTLPATEED
jgi:hypothetical protein